MHIMYLNTHEHVTPKACGQLMNIHVVMNDSSFMQSFLHFQVCHRFGQLLQPDFQTLLLPHTYLPEFLSHPVKS